MSDSSQNSWSEDPDAPRISSQEYSEERSKFAGVASCGIFYGTPAYPPVCPYSPHLFDLVLGIVFILFFQCMGALLNPTNGTGVGTRRLLVVHTVAMFLFVTMYTAVNLQMQFTAYIDNRGFPGFGDLPPGPLGFQYILYHKPSGIISTIMFLLNNWLADGLLVGVVLSSTAQASD